VSKSIHQFHRDALLGASGDEHPLLTLLVALNLPPVVIGFVIGGFIAAIFSTADELLNCCGYAFLADFLNLPRGDEIPKEVDEGYISSGKFYIGLFAVLAAIPAYFAIEYEKPISNFFNAVIGTQVVFLFPLLYGLYRPRNARKIRFAALLSMLLAFLVSFGLTILGLFIGGDEGKSLIDLAPLAAFFVSLISMGVGWVTMRIKGHATTEGEVTL